MTGWMIVVTVVAILWGTLAFCRAASDADDTLEGYQIVSPGYVPPEPPPEPWVKYPVPLDDDLQKYITQLCREKELDPAIVFAVIGLESQYQADVIGDNGNSYGLMQIYKSVHEDRMERLGVTDLLDPYENVKVGVDILAELMSWGHGIDYTLSFYNGHGGEPCEYAVTVQRNAECLLEGAMVVAE